jgi:hypothetical protein
MFTGKIVERGAVLGRSCMSIYKFALRPAAVFCLILTMFSLPAFASRDGSTDRPGLDYRTFELSAPNPDLCETACKREKQCRSWTYAWPGAKGPKAMCALKTGVPPKRSDTCCISGVMSTSGPVTRTDDPKPQPAPQRKAEQDEKTPAGTESARPAAPAQQPQVKSDEPARQARRTPPAAQERVTVTPRPKPPQPQPDEDPAEPAQTGQDSSAISDAKAAQCRDYASRAIEQNRENRRLNCGLSGSRWGFSYQAYYNYCARNPASAWQSARSGRDSELGLCKRRIAARQDDDGIRLPEIPDVDVDIGDLFNEGRRDRRFCRNFAEQSVRQASEARRLNCGFGGRQWSRSRVRQTRLCEQVGPRQAARVLNERAALLDRCRADAGGRGFADAGNCSAYASASVRQARIARRLGCGFRGARWTTNYRAHLRWCRKVPARESDREIRIRDRFLDRCE